MRRPSATTVLRIASGLSCISYNVGVPLFYFLKTLDIRSGMDTLMNPIISVIHTSAHLGPPELLGWNDRYGAGMEDHKVIKQGILRNTLTQLHYMKLMRRGEPGWEKKTNRTFTRGRGINMKRKRNHLRIKSMSVDLGSCSGVLVSSFEVPYWLIRPSGFD